MLFSYNKVFSKKIEYGIAEQDEEGESGGDKINWPDDRVFTDRYWERI